ncbi:GNAT family N-acetyltransferase [Clostridium cibarium]|uniref:GNAT family N-acetyltransferase n=1 Tax=Clostridium cibarium TaxID=2762247 RepID=A0ABR8PVV4_9CLOT|nr:GNAT family N-acetyltransferase [Clostridium cibarium]MBD7912264.1 GNAT family N-acetyltransferase [Clostridium cibarium]
MNHLGTVEIETERLKLRKFYISDAKAMFNNWANDSEVTKYLTWPALTSVKAAENTLSNWINNYSDSRFYQWAIVLKEDVLEPIGTISVVHMDEEIDMVHVGYCVGRKCWNKGITSEAFKGIIPFLIEKVEVKRIESRHDPRNPNSGKVMLKCGLQYEGTLRKADINNQGICDASMYALLAEDYYKS